MGHFSENIMHLKPYNCDIKTSFSLEWKIPHLKRELFIHDGKLVLILIALYFSSWRRARDPWLWLHQGREVGGEGLLHHRPGGVQHRGLLLLRGWMQQRRHVSIEAFSHVSHIVKIVLCCWERLNFPWHQFYKCLIERGMKLARSYWHMALIWIWSFWFIKTVSIELSGIQRKWKCAGSASFIFSHLSNDGEIKSHASTL